MHTGHTFGGSALDRLIFEFDPTGDGSDAGAGGVDDAGAAPSPETAATVPAIGADGEPDPSAGATDAAPAWTPEQIQALRNDPEFRDFLAEEAAQIADTRFTELLSGYAASGGDGTGADGGEQFDANEYLNPLGDNFGANLIEVLKHNRQETLDAVRSIFAPVAEQNEAAAAAERDELLSSTITETAGRDGGLRGGDLAVKRVMAAVRNTYMPEMTKRYGPTERAAQLAIERAIGDERAYQKSVVDAGIGEHGERMGELALVHPELGNGAGSGVVTLGDKALSSRELALKYGGRAQASGRGA